MRTGRPITDPARLNLAVELIKNGATTAEAARSVGLHRNTLSVYGISKRVIDKSKEAFRLIDPPRRPQTAHERLDLVEREIASSFLLAVARARVPLIATAEAAQMESDKLQVCVRAEKLRRAAKRIR